MRQSGASSLGFGKDAALVQPAQDELAIAIQLQLSAELAAPADLRAKGFGAAP